MMTTRRPSRSDRGIALLLVLVERPPLLVDDLVEGLHLAVALTQSSVQSGELALAHK